MVTNQPHLEQPYHWAMSTPKVNFIRVDNISISHYKLFKFFAILSFFAVLCPKRTYFLHYRRTNTPRETRTPPQEQRSGNAELNGKNNTPRNNFRKRIKNICFQVIKRTYFLHYRRTKKRATTQLVH